MIDGLRSIHLEDRDQGSLRLLVAIPVAGDPWGILVPLRGTPWERLVRVVPGSALSHAMHGYATPLVRALGPDPAKVGRRLDDRDARCMQWSSCLTPAPTCRAGHSMPDCFDGGSDIASILVTSLRDGWHVIVVEGPEFVVS